MNGIKKGVVFLLGALAVFAVYAAEPASIDYVNMKIAILQAEINAIINAGG